jgi:hypothetical protein
MVASLCSNYSILAAITTSIIGEEWLREVPQPLVYLYHPHHLYYLYHHDLSEQLHHDLISILGKGQNNVHKGGRRNHSYHTELVPTEIHWPKSVHHSPVDNPSEYEHHHMFNKIVLVVDQRMKVMVSMHPSLRNLTRVIPDLHNSHHHHYEVVRWTVVHEK